jgi:hypothetical protein
LVRGYDVDGVLTAGDMLAAAAPGTESETFVLPVEAPLEHRVEDADHAGLMIATYVAAAWIDDNADGVLDDGAEIVVGADSDALLVHLSGTVPEGWVEGWQLADNHFDQGDAAGDPTFTELSNGTAIVGRGLQDLSLELSGSYQAFGGSTQGLVGLAVDSEGDPNLDDPVFDIILGGTTFDVSLNTAPGSEFEFYSPEAGARIAVVGAVIYTDADSNGEYTWLLELDPDAHSMCLNNEPVGLFYLGSSNSLAAILGLDVVGWQAGWMAVTGNPDQDQDLVRLTESEATSLAIGPSCSL